MVDSEPEEKSTMVLDIRGPASPIAAGDEPWQTG